MQIKSLDPTLEPVFLKHANQDISDYYFFVFDWKYNKDQTKILLALEANRIDGMMLIYRQRIVQLRGSCEAVKALLEKLDLKKVELQAPEQHKLYVLDRYKPTWSHQMMLMTLSKGEERLHKEYPTVVLDISDAERVAVIMRDADPVYWGDQTDQQIVENMKQGVTWLGVKVNRELISLGSARLTEWTGLIGVVATHEDHRNRGYATSIVSELVKRILEKRSNAMIYVLKDNPPAIRVYERIGFKPYRTYFFMRGEKR